MKTANETNIDYYGECAKLNTSKQLKLNKLSIALLFCSLGAIQNVSAAGYYSQRNIQTLASKNVQDNVVFNNQTLTLQANTTRNATKGLPYGVGHVANTQFANTGYAGCGVSYPLMQAIYQTAGQNKNYANNYLALNVYSHLLGYDSNAPVWSSSSGEGNVKGYLNFAQGNLAYPYRQYLRSMPALYPSYLGLYDNGKSCGRWAQVSTGSICSDDSGANVGYASKVCTSQPATSYNKTFYGYVFDSCEDNNGWCRDDDAHVDINSAAIGDNDYLSWKFVQNPYYTDPSAPSQLKDVWLAWYNNPVNAWWTYIEVANLPDGLGMLQFNIGSSSNPIWVNSHMQAGGSNTVTWTEGTSNGQTWQLQPMGSATDSAPPSNPTYQIRLFDLNGYPVKNGQIYQFDLTTTLKTGSQPVGGEVLFYKGQPGQGSSIVKAPTTGTATLTVNVGNLHSGFNLSSINPVLIDSNGFSYNPTSCTTNSCSFQKLPSGTTYTFYGVYSNETSNDLVVRKSQSLIVNQSGIALNGTSGSANLNASSWDFTTTYTGAVTVPVTFKVTKPTAKSVNANLQALFVPVNNSAVTANTQGCFLNNYYPQTGTSTPTTCYLYYTAHQKGSFNTDVPSMSFNVLLPTDIGVGSSDHLQLQSAVNTQVKINGYNPGSSLVIPQTISNITYQTATGNQRTAYVILDPNSDQSCLNSLSSLNVHVGSNSPITFTASKIDQPVLASISAAAILSGTANMQSGAQACQVNFSQPSLTPGLDLVAIVKLSSGPNTSTNPNPPSGNQGVNITASADNPACLNQNDILNFGNTKVNYTVSTTNTQVKLDSGNYQVSNQPYNVNGGTCSLTPTSVNVVANQFSNLSLNYHYSASPSSGGSCSATANVSSSSGWNGCNVTFDVTNGGSSAISSVILKWAGSNNAIQPWGGVTVTTNAGTVSTQLPVYNPIQPGNKVIGNSQGWGMTIQDGNVCSALASAKIQCN